MNSVLFWEMATKFAELFSAITFSEFFRRLCFATLFFPFEKIFPTFTEQGLYRLYCNTFLRREIAIKHAELFSLIMFSELYTCLLYNFVFTGYIIVM